jgi:hypothetical protein
MHIIKTILITLTCGLIFACTNIQAEESPQILTVSKLEYCNIASKMGGTILQERYTGMSLQKALNKAENDKLVIAIVLDAYDVPWFSTKEHQEKAIQRFEEILFMDCYHILVLK